MRHKGLLASPAMKGLAIGGAIVGTYIVASTLLKARGFGGALTLIVHVQDKSTRTSIRGALVTVNQGVVSQPNTTDLNGNATVPGLSMGAINLSISAAGYTSTSQNANMAYDGQTITISLSMGTTCQCPTTCPCGMTCDSSSCPNCYPQPIGAIIPNSPQNIVLSWQVNKWCISQGLIASILPGPDGLPLKAVPTNCSSNCTVQLYCSRLPKQWTLPVIAGQLVDTNGKAICNASVNLALSGTQSITLSNGSIISITIVPSTAYTDSNGMFGMVLAATITDPTTDQGCCFSGGGCNISAIPQLLQVTATPAGTARGYPITIAFNHFVSGNCALFG